MTDINLLENPAGWQNPGTISPTRTCTLNNTNRSERIVDYDRGATPWMTVFGSLCIIVATYGLLASNGVFLTYWNSHQLSNYSKERVGWITGVHLFLTLFLGALTGTLFDIYGSRMLLPVGSLLYLLGIFVLGECSEYWHFMLSYGVLSGIGCAIISTVAFSVVSHWFDKKRGLANGVVIMGGSLGGIVFPLVLRFILEPLGWSWSIRILGILMSALVIVGNISVKSRKAGNAGFTLGVSGFRDPRIIYLVIGITAFDFVLFGALGLLPTFALYLDYDNATSINVVAILNAGSGVGRVVSGIVADRLGRFNVLVISSALSLFTMLAFLFPAGKSAYLLYIFAATFGFASGSVLSLEPTCIGQLCKAEQYGRYFGMIYVPVSFITLLCIPIGTTILLTLGAYGFVSLFSFCLFVSALSFVMARRAVLRQRWGWRTKI